MKCNGKAKGQNFEIGLGQCKKGLLYRREIIEKNGVIRIGNFVCQECIDDNVDCDLAHASSHSSYDHAIFSSSHFDPVNNPCKLGSICNSGKCVKIGLVTTEGTTVDIPLACSTELWHNNNQCSKTRGTKRTTSLGDDYILGENTTKQFIDWINEIKQTWKKKMLIDILEIKRKLINHGLFILIMLLLEILGFNLKFSLIVLVFTLLL